MTRTQRRLKSKDNNMKAWACQTLTKVALTTTLSVAPIAFADDFLPMMGDSTSGIISLQKEHQLGQAWVRTLRGRARLYDDPLTYSYLNDLIWNLVSHSQMQDKRIELVVMDNATLNAFAVPGGVVGVHAGLFLSTEHEDELASVLAHELAHLSQRHFAAQLEEARRSRPFTLAKLLASILVASADSEAGAAAISSTIASQQSSALAFSRQNEQEADRLGMQTLVSAGFDPSSMPRMFSRLMQSQRFDTNRLPEFLLTHPVSQSRIADALNRSSQLPTPRKPDQDSIDFLLAKTRIAVHYTENQRTLLQNYQRNVEQSPTPINLYGYMVTAYNNGQVQLAEAQFNRLPSNWKRHPSVLISKADGLIENRQYDNAISILKRLNDDYPDTYTVMKYLAKAYFNSGKTQDAIREMQVLTRKSPNDVDNWYLLSEAYGQAGQTMNVHFTRIEYFLLTGQTDRADQQIRYAKRDSDKSESTERRLTQLEQETREVRDAMKMDY
jgi:predicted Zn-dependent protease